MKINHLFLAGTLFLATASFAQKDELKALKKLYAKDALKTEEYTEYKNLVQKLEGLATEESDKVYLKFYKAMVPMMEMATWDKNMSPVAMQTQMVKLFSPNLIEGMATAMRETLDYEAKTGKKVYTDDINETVQMFKGQLLNVAITLGNSKQYVESSKVLYSVFLMEPKEMDNLYFAANYAVEGKDYDSALKYYDILKSKNYTGEGIKYFAKNKLTGEVESFSDKAIRNKFVELGQYIEPTEEKTPSKRGEIVKNIALIHIQRGNVEAAKSAIADAKKELPGDTNLLLSEADIYLKMNDISSYQKVIKEVLEKNPDDHILIYNLGVTSGNNNQFEEAEKYYRRVIEIKPDYADAYVNLADMMLKPDQKIVEEMNKLGYNEKDQKRFEFLKGERQKLFNKVLPLLESAYKLQPNNEGVINGLLTVYKFLERNDKVKELKAQLGK
ncbi:tetratricopeptide repeat protein [Flavobacterium sp.]|jgi:tetratricopeptide (TPR) repeat protein|uniref:tetratricopeptide repeat protein n=1 Tax=Flavobacterium sp. TaxID=239 RepID=UPI0022BDDB8A|nr:tetratricopeptide repeat protein [Flavobacterium sp.]MCZ8145626.1 tetratricopeptide repeat protein [Flavobacterium sp.]MCZ8367258.1 tetratricopeptide repeat protein [Flavobacterium sp.]